MKAVVLHGKGDARIEEVAPRPLQAGEVRIQIEAALTCGTDLKVFKRGYHAKMIVPPAIFGHEFAGIITEVRKAGCTRAKEDLSANLAAVESMIAAPHWRVGDRVVVANSAPCGECFYCRHRQ